MLHDGQAVAAYVKNLSADGKYYWVMALATPVKNGYLSVRLKPSSPIFAKVQQFYASILESEQRASGNSHELQIQAGMERLLHLITSLGFDSYQSFMHHALAIEMQYRRTALEGKSTTSTLVRRSSLNRLSSLNQQCHELAFDLQKLFDQTTGVRDMNRSVLTQSSKISRVADVIRMLSLNAKICAFRDDEARTLREVANALDNVSTEIQSITHKFSDQAKQTGASLERLGFDICVARLQVDLTSQFLSEIQSATTEAIDELTLQNVLIVLTELHERSTRIFQSLDNASTSLATLNTEVEKLARNNRRLSFVEFAGQKEAVVYDSTDTFSVVFNEVHEQYSTGLDSCNELFESMKYFRDVTRNLLKERDSINRQLDEIGDSIRTLQPATV